MSLHRVLHGSCACGRNEYVIDIPANTSEVAQVIFDRSNSYHRTISSPLSAHLRVPLTSYHSTTYAFFPDETHAAIRRTYTSPLETSAKRNFCGFCGTPLSYWSESPPSEAEYISVTLGSLMSSDLRDLEELGLLPKELSESDVDEQEIEVEKTPESQEIAPLRVRQGLPWFETMLEGSKLGNVRVSRGEKELEGRRVEWEVVEWTNEDENEKSSGTGNSHGKRKLEDDEVMTSS